jgi:hypothetical protein
MLVCVYVHARATQEETEARGLVRFYTELSVHSLRACAVVAHTCCSLRCVLI